MLRTANHMDTLTEREPAVLRLLPAPCLFARSPKALRVGERRKLYVSVNTVKTHAQAIYRKLGVPIRDEAPGLSQAPRAARARSRNSSSAMPSASLGRNRMVPLPVLSPG